MSSLRPIPGQVAAYILCFLRSDNKSGVSNVSTSSTTSTASTTSTTKCTFTFEVRYSDIPDYGGLKLSEMDFRVEEAVFGTKEGRFERRLVEQAERIARANAEGRIEGLGVVMLMMGLDRCRSAFAEFLAAVMERVEEEVKWGGRKGVVSGLV